MKRTIEMTQEELNRKTIIEQVIDKRITQKEGARRVGIGERHFRRVLAGYRVKGDIGLVSGHRQKPSNNRLKEDLRQRIQRVISDPIFSDFGPTFLAEKLEEYEGIVISRETMRQLMIEQGMHHPKVKKKRAHPQRERRRLRGELVQIDGSYHAWLEDRGPKGCLLLFVDDATSAVLAAEFVEHESFFAYARLCKSYFRSTGLPVAFYSDKFSVFRVNAKSSAHSDAITQFNRVMNYLGVDHICANSPQAKGRVERANQTFQDRLVKELRLHYISTYQEANAYLPEFLRAYNHKFAVFFNSADDAHKPLDQTIDLNFLFSVHDTRFISKDLQFQFDNVTYQIITNRPARHLAKREVLILQDETGKVSAFLNEQFLTLKEFRKLPKSARIASTKSIEHQPAIPAFDHPWRTYGKKLNGSPVLIPDQ